MTGADHWVQLGQERVPVEIRRNARARRFVLRVDGASRRLVLTVPARASVSEGLAFVERKAVWAQNRLALIPPPIRFAPGTDIPLLGEPHTIRHRPDARGGVWRDGGEIHVTGEPRFLPRRVEDWLRAEAKREIAERARDMAASVDRRIARVTVRDTRSRWGSCSSQGSLNFSWRLIFAPEWVLDYVVAHEVGHLVHMDHSPRFWAVVDRLVDNRESARKWLHRHGAGLYRYGGGQ